jgi:hypothetical protein
VYFSRISSSRDGRGEGGMEGGREGGREGLNTAFLKSIANLGLLALRKYGCVSAKEYSNAL